MSDALCDDLRQAGSVSALARQTGIHRETLQNYLHNKGESVATVLGKTRKGRYANVFTMPSSGIPFYLAHPRPEMVYLPDILHSLAVQARWNGHGPDHYSIAEHVIRVARRVLDKTGNRRFALCALHHDSHECYIGDIARPVRKLLGPALDRIISKIDVAIVEALRLNDAWEAAQPHIQEADVYFLYQEALAFGLDGMRLGEEVPRLWVPKDIVRVERFSFHPWDEAEQLLAEAHLELAA